MPMTIATDEGGNVMTCIDGSHAARADGKGHSDLFATIGKGAMIKISKKLGLVTTSSTEAELVSTGERFPKCAWFHYFRTAQGDAAKEDLLFQDDESQTLLRKNYPFSIGKVTKYINTRCSFIVDEAEKKESKVANCPTEDVIAHYSTKPTQGGLFVLQRNMIQVITPKDFKMNKAWHERVLRKYDLWEDEESNLTDI